MKKEKQNRRKANAFYAKQIRGGCFAVRDGWTKSTIDIVVTKESADGFVLALNEMRETLRRVINR